MPPLDIYTEDEVKDLEEYKNASEETQNKMLRLWKIPPPMTIDQLKEKKAPQELIDIISNPNYESLVPLAKEVNIRSVRRFLKNPEKAENTFKPTLSKRQLEEMTIEKEIKSKAVEYRSAMNKLLQQKSFFSEKTSQYIGEDMYNKLRRQLLMNLLEKKEIKEDETTIKSVIEYVLNPKNVTQSDIIKDAAVNQLKRNTVEDHKLENQLASKFGGGGGGGSNIDEETLKKILSKATGFTDQTITDRLGKAVTKIEQLSTQDSKVDELEKVVGDLQETIKSLNDIEALNGGVFPQDLRDAIVNEVATRVAANLASQGPIGVTDALKNELAQLKSAIASIPAAPTTSTTISPDSLNQIKNEIVTALNTQNASLNADISSLATWFNNIESQLTNNNIITATAATVNSGAVATAPSIPTPVVHPVRAGPATATFAPPADLVREALPRAENPRPKIERMFGSAGPLPGQAEVASYFYY